MRDLQTKLDDVIINLDWGDFAHDYFPQKSASWFYNKLRGRDGNGGEGGFTPDEQQQLKGALCDMADRLRAAADKI